MHVVDQPETFRHRTVAADLRQIEAIRHAGTCEWLFVKTPSCGVLVLGHLTVLALRPLCD
jgi:hypothetical protein